MYSIAALPALLRQISLAPPKTLILKVAPAPHFWPVSQNLSCTILGAQLTLGCGARSRHANIGPRARVFRALGMSRATSLAKAPPHQVADSLVPRGGKRAFGGLHPVGKEICKAWGHSGIGGHRYGGCQAPAPQPERRPGYLKKVSGLRLAVQGIRGAGFSRGNLKGLDKAGEEEDDGEDI